MLRTRFLLTVSRAYIRFAGLSVKRCDNVGDAKSILVFKLDELGDVILISSFLAQLRAHFPDAHISLVTKAGVAAAVDACPYVNDVIPYDNPVGVRSFIGHLIKPITFGRALAQSKRYDLAINARWDRDSYGASVMAVFSKALFRVAFSEHVNTEKAWEYKGFDTLATNIATAERLTHEVEKLQRLFPAMSIEPSHYTPVLEYWSAASSSKEAKEALHELGIDSTQPFVVVCASHGHSKLKAWPVERFTALVQLIRGRYSVPVILAGSQADAYMSNAIVSTLNDSGVTSICGKLSISASAELIRCARLFIGADSGLTHVAAATGTPLVALFGSSCSHRFRPWSPVARTFAIELPCGPCAGDHSLDRCTTCLYPSPLCMESISVEQVLGLVDEQLDEAVETLQAAVMPPPIED